MRANYVFVGAILQALLLKGSLPVNIKTDCKEVTIRAQRERESSEKEARAGEKMLVSFEGKKYIRGKERKGGLALLVACAANDVRCSQNIERERERMEKMMKKTLISVQAEAAD